MCIRKMITLRRTQDIAITITRIRMRTTRSARKTRTSMSTCIHTTTRTIMGIRTVIRTITATGIITTTMSWTRAR